MNAATAHDTLDRVYARLRSLKDLLPCEHGHFDCSYRDSGPCSNEAYARLYDPAQEAR